MLQPASALAAGRGSARASARLPGPVRHHLEMRAAAGVPVSGYVYDPEVAAQRSRALRSALPPWARLLFAVKANRFPPVLAALVAGGVDGFEVASVTEADLAHRAMREAGRSGRVVAAGPAKHPGLLAALVDAGVDVVHVESALELRRLSRVAVERGVRIAVALRVNPAAVAVGGTLAMGGRPAAFGVPEPDVPAVLDLAAALPGLDVVGVHVHAVCGNRDAAAHVAYVDWCLRWAGRVAREQGLDLRWVDVGGGLGVAYSGEDPLDLGALADGLDRLRPPEGVEVALEPGRWLAADCGWYAAEVVDVKRSYGTWFAVVRGGIGGFALPVTEEFPFPVTVLPVERWPAGLPRPEVADALVTVAGELCTPEDVLARDVAVERVRAGDLLVVPRAGAYGWEFALQPFLGHPVATREAVAAVPAPLPPPVPEPRVLEVTP